MGKLVEGISQIQTSSSQKQLDEFEGIGEGSDFSSSAKDSGGENPSFVKFVEFGIEERSPDILAGRDMLFVESWHNEIDIDAYVVELRDNQVFCECCLDSEKMQFQTYVFSSEDFAHLDVEVRMPIRLRIKTKSGSKRIDIFSGIGIVDMSVFDTEHIWAEIDDGAFNEPFKYSSD